MMTAALDTMTGFLQRLNETVATTTAAAVRRGSFAAGSADRTGSTASSQSSSNSSCSGSQTGSLQHTSATPTVIFPSGVRRIPFAVPGSWSLFGGNGSGPPNSTVAMSTASSNNDSNSPDVSGFRSRYSGSRNRPGSRDDCGGSLSPATTRIAVSRRYSSGRGPDDNNCVTHSNESTIKTGAEFVIPLDYRAAGRSLGTIDPRLYKLSTDDADDEYDIPDNHVGRIWFSVKYESQSEKLLVTLVKARNLSSRIGITGLTGGTSGAVGDHYVRLYLLPDERRYLQSKFKKKTANPQFDEHFVFQISCKDLENRVLKLTVFEIDRHKRHVVVGHALYQLRDYSFMRMSTSCAGTRSGSITAADNATANGSGQVTSRTSLIWRDLEREVTESTSSDNGELLISLCYKRHLERLTIGILEGKNFKNNESYSPPDVYARVCLQQQTKVIKTKKTDVVRRSTCPSFNESFTFRVAQSDLDMSSLVVTLLLRQSNLHRDRVLGRVVLGSFMFSRGKELEHWNRMASETDEQVVLWHNLL